MADENDEPVGLAEQGQYQNEVDEIAARQGVGDARGERHAAERPRTCTGGRSCGRASSASRRRTPTPRCPRSPTRRTRAASGRPASARGPLPCRRRPPCGRGCRPRSRASPPRRDSWNFSRASSPSQPSTIECRRKSAPPIAWTGGRSITKNGAAARPISDANDRHRVRRHPRARDAAADRERDPAVEVPRHESLRVLDEAPAGAAARRAAVGIGGDRVRRRPGGAVPGAPRARARRRRDSTAGALRPGGTRSAVSADAPSRAPRISGVAPAMTTRSNPARRAASTVRRIVGSPSRGAAGETSTAPSGGTRTSTESPLTAVASSRRASPPAAASRPAGGFLGEVHEIGAERRLREIAAARAALARSRRGTR